MMRKWEELPKELQLDTVRPYYEILEKKKISMVLKRAFDIVVSMLLLIVLSPLFLMLAIAIKIESPGSVIYRQTRITQYYREFRIHKFRSMRDDADEIGTLVTINGDERITKVGQFLRKYKLDELPQLIDVLQGNMSLVGTRPEVPRYVAHYTEEMMATLLLPAGITSESSLCYMNENQLLGDTGDIDRYYIEDILPKKMKINLDSIEKFSILSDVLTIIRTAAAVVEQ